MSTQNITNIADFRSNLSKYIEQVAETGKLIILVRYGDPVAALIPGSDIDSFEEWKRKQLSGQASDEVERVARFQQMSEDIKQRWDGQNSKYKTTQEEVDSNVLISFFRLMRISSVFLRFYNPVFI